MKILFILNDPPYGSERTYNGLRMAGLLSKQEGNAVQVFLIGYAASSAHRNQKVPQGFYSIEVMLGNVIRHGGEVGISALAWMRAASEMAKFWTARIVAPWRSWPNGLHGRTRFWCSENAKGGFLKAA